MLLQFVMWCFGSELPAKKSQRSRLVRGWDSCSRDCRPGLLRSDQIWRTPLLPQLFNQACQYIVSSLLSRFHPCRCIGQFFDILLASNLRAMPCRTANFLLNSSNSFLLQSIGSVLLICATASLVFHCDIFACFGYRLRFRLGDRLTLSYLSTVFCPSTLRGESVPAYVSSSTRKLSSNLRNTSSLMLPIVSNVYVGVRFSRNFQILATDLDITSTAYIYGNFTNCGKFHCIWRLI